MGHQCCSKQKVKRGLWSPEEDEKLITHITIHGHTSWSSVPKLAGTCVLFSVLTLKLLYKYTFTFYVYPTFLDIYMYIITTMQSLNPNYIGPAP